MGLPANTIKVKFLQFLAGLVGGCYLNAYALDIGQVAPPFSIKTVTGATYTNENLLGRVVLIHFWASWCEPCQKEMPILAQYEKKHANQGFLLLMIDTDSSEDIPKALAQLKQYDLTGALKQEVSFTGYGRIWKVPLSFVVDQKGVLRQDAWDGENDHGLTEDILEKEITPLLLQNHKG